MDNSNINDAFSNLMAAINSIKTYLKANMTNLETKLNTKRI